MNIKLTVLATIGMISFTFANNLSAMEDKEDKQIQKGGTYFYEQNDLIKRINTISSNKKLKKELFQFSSVYFKSKGAENLVPKEKIFPTSTAVCSTNLSFSRFRVARTSSLNTS